MPLNATWYLLEKGYTLYTAPYSCYRSISVDEQSPTQLVDGRVTVVSTSRLLVFSRASSSKSRWKDNKKGLDNSFEGPTFVHYQTSSTTDNLWLYKVHREEVCHKERHGEI